MGQIILQNAATAIGNGIPYTMVNDDRLDINITGSNITSSTVVFEVLGTDGNYESILGFRMNDWSTNTQTTTLGEWWSFDGLLGKTFRARIGALTGTNATLSVIGLAVK